MDIPIVLPNDDGIRPAGKENECFYCDSKIGEPHKKECVCIVKRIRVRYTYEIEIDVPHRWTPVEFEFHRNESSWCSDNSIDDLQNYVNELDKLDTGCLCNGNRFRAEFIEDVDNTPRRAVPEPKPLEQ